MKDENFEAMLTGGHPNSLGRTVEVVDIVLSNHDRLEEIYNCYFSEDEVVRLRTSSAIKRITLEKPDWLIPYIDRLLDVISKIDQASTQWTLAILFEILAPKMTTSQFAKALGILKKNLETHNDWIVLNTTMDTLGRWASEDDNLKTWLLPHLKRLSKETRKSIAGRAKKVILALDK
jgi:hypothetical protein